MYCVLFLFVCLQGKGCGKTCGTSWWYQTAAILTPRDRARPHSPAGARLGLLPKYLLNRLFCVRACVGAGFSSAHTPGLALSFRPCSTCDSGGPLHLRLGRSPLSLRARDERRRSSPPEGAEAAEEGRGCRRDPCAECMRLRYSHTPLFFLPAVQGERDGGRASLAMPLLLPRHRWARRCRRARRRRLLRHWCACGLVCSAFIA